MISSPVSAGADGQLSASARFAIAAVCCGVFLITVLMLVRATGQSPLTALRSVALTFWGVSINFVLCLGAVAYVSRRLHKARSAAAELR